MKNIIYIKHLQDIGGVESVIYEISKKYKNKDITILYKTGNQKQINRIKKYCRVKQWNGKEEIECELLILNYCIDILDYVKAKKIVQLVHAMYITNKVIPHTDPRINEYWAVSEIVAKEYEELTGIKCRIVRNPIEIIEEEKRKVLWLISATRLSWEKGKDNMIKFADRLTHLNIPFIWLIYTNDTEKINNSNVIYMKPTLDIRPIIHSFKGKGYGVQFSKCEGDCIFTKECRALGLPVLVTPVPAFIEQGVKDGENGYILPYDVNQATDEEIKRIYENIPEIEYTKFNDIYEELLVKGESTYEGVKTMKVRALDTYVKFNKIDGELGFTPNPGYEWEMTEERFKELTEREDGLIYVEKVEEPLKEVKKPRTKKK